KRASEATALPRNTPRSTEGEKSQKELLFDHRLPRAKRAPLSPWHTGRAAVTGRGSVTSSHHLIRRAKPVIKRLLEQRDAAQIRIRKMNPPVRLGRGSTRPPPHESRPRANHRVSPSHDVDPFRQRTNVVVRPGEIRQYNIRTTSPIHTQQ